MNDSNKKLFKGVANLSATFPRGVIFDVDGTLIDSNDAHAHAFVDAFTEVTENVPFSRVRLLIGMGSDKLIPQALGRPVSEDERERIDARKKEIFARRYLPSLRPFPRVRELLEKLKAQGLRLATATSAAGDELRDLLRVGDLQSYFDRTASSHDAAESKPDPDIVQAAIRRLGLARDALVMVGDTPYDVAAARRAGLAVIALRCGGWDLASLKQANYVSRDPASLLKEWNQLFQISQRAA